MMQDINSQDVTQKIFFITDLEKIIGRNRLTIRRWWLEGKFPQPVKLHGTTLAWNTKTINEWLNQNIG